MRFAIHMFLHFAVPAWVARKIDPQRFWRTWGVLMATMAVDLDHFLADPIFDPDRCSIGFHPLHTWPAVVVYGVLTAFPKTRLVGLGLLIHMGLDLMDCWWMMAER